MGRPARRRVSRRSPAAVRGGAHPGHGRRRPTGVRAAVAVGCRPSRCRCRCQARSPSRPAGQACYQRGGRLLPDALDPGRPSLGSPLLRQNRRTRARARRRGATSTRPSPRGCARPRRVEHVPAVRTTWNRSRSPLTIDRLGRGVLIVPIHVVGLEAVGADPAMPARQHLHDHWDLAPARRHGRRPRADPVRPAGPPRPGTPAAGPDQASTSRSGRAADRERDHVDERAPS